MTSTDTESWRLAVAEVAALFPDIGCSKWHIAAAKTINPWIATMSEPVGGRSNATPELPKPAAKTTEGDVTAKALVRTVGPKAKDAD